MIVVVEVGLQMSVGWLEMVEKDCGTVFVKVETIGFISNKLYFKIGLKKVANFSII